MKPEALHQMYEVLGWVGVVFVLGSYCLLALGIIDGNSWMYHSLVLAGSAFVAIISYQKRAFQPLVLNAIFALLAIIALIRLALINL